MLVERTCIDSLSCSVNGLEVNDRRICTVAALVSLQRIVKFGVGECSCNSRFQTTYITGAFEVGEYLFRCDHKSPVSLAVAAYAACCGSVFQLSQMTGCVMSHIETVERIVSRTDSVGSRMHEEREFVHTCKHLVDGIVLSLSCLADILLGKGICPTKVRRGFIVIVVGIVGSKGNVVPTCAVDGSIAVVHYKSVRVSFWCPHIVVGIVGSRISTCTDIAAVCEVYKSVVLVTCHQLIPSGGVATFVGKAELRVVHIVNHIDNYHSVLVANVEFGDRLAIACNYLLIIFLLRVCCN